MVTWQIVVSERPYQFSQELLASGPFGPIKK